MTESEIVSKFKGQIKDYEDLSIVVKQILTSRAKNEGIKVVYTSSRVKELKSFLDKIKRKKYKNPFEQTTDFAGVRLVFLYKDDLAKIEDIIHSEFDVLESYSTNELLDDDQFGYGASHFIVKLKIPVDKKVLTHIKDLKCEIQVRTPLQDCWALISHQLDYKRNIEIPSSLRRSLFALSGSFETLDEQILKIRDNRIEYINKIEKLDYENFLKQELNIDNFKNYLKNKFPTLPFESDSSKHFDLSNEIFSLFIKKNYQQIKDLDTLLKKTEKARELFNSEETFGKTALRAAFISLGLKHIDLISEFALEEDKKLINKYRNLVE